MGNSLLNSRVCRQQLSRCVTKTQPLWSLTMAPACARPVSPVMTPPGLSSPPSLVAQGTRYVMNKCLNSEQHFHKRAKFLSKKNEIAKKVSIPHDNPSI